MSTLSDFFGDATDILGTSSVVDLYKTYNEQKIALGIAESKRTIDELNASSMMLRTQNEAILAQAQAAKLNSESFSFAGLDLKKIAPYALAAGGLYLVYRLLK